jgi:hypothetical protein
MKEAPTLHDAHREGQALHLKPFTPCSTMGCRDTLRGDVSLDL